MNEQPQFAFVIHPLSLEDVSRFEPKAEGKSPKLIEKVLEWTPAFKLSDIRGVVSRTGKTIAGCFVACPLIPKLILEKERAWVMERIVSAAKVAEECGAKIVGLGGYTSVAGDAGVTVAKEVDIAVTTGSSFTVGAALQALRRAAQLREVSLKEKTVCVVGATGSIGSVCAQMLAEEAGELILVARNRRKLKLMHERLSAINPNVSYGEEIAAVVPKSDALVVATSTPYAIIEPEHLKPEAIVLDVSTPRNVSEEVAESRPDCLVIDGGVMEVPGDVEFNFDFGFPKRLAYACMSETMILALEERFENFSLGREIARQNVETICHLADKHGFKLAAFRSFGKPLDPQRLYPPSSVKTFV